MTEIFLGREALGDGLSRAELRRWYRPIYRGVYAPKWAKLTVEERAFGAWLTSDRTGVVTGVAASALHGADWVDDHESIEILANERRRQPGLTVRMDRVADDEIMTLRGMAVATPARAAFELGRYLEKHLALGRLDALMRAAPFRTEKVSVLIDRYGPVRGVVQLRELLPLIDTGAESMKESWLRLLLIDDGFPTPQTQIPVLEDGMPFAYLDMGWPEIKLAVEYDGDQHQTSRPQYVKDLRRLPKVQGCDWEVIRVIKEDRRAEILPVVWEAFNRRGGAEIYEMAGFTRTSEPNRWFGRSERAA